MKSGGISIYPLEIEGVLYKHPEVVEAAVIGVPDSQWGEALKAVVVLQKDSKTGGTELIQFCKDQLASYKVPKSVDIVTSLPRHASCKGGDGFCIGARAKFSKGTLPKGLRPLSL